MNNWEFYNVNYLGTSIINDNTGQIPHQAKYRIIYVNTDTGELSSITDLESKKYKRNKCLELFHNVYNKHFKAKKISIFSVVVNEEEYGSISKFINTITRKLKRKGIERFGYVWVRDIGEIKFQKHFHIIIATSKVEKKLFNTLFNKKQHNAYNIEFMNSSKGIINYIKEKELYGKKRQRTFGKSRFFPLNTICKTN